MVCGYWPGSPTRIQILQMASNKHNPEHVLKCQTASITSTQSMQFLAGFGEAWLTLGVALALMKSWGIHSQKPFLYVDLVDSLWRYAHTSCDWHGASECTLVNEAGCILQGLAQTHTTCSVPILCGIRFPALSLSLLSCWLYKAKLLT